jgi:site-specific DNA-methyltransferase (adenine-specific)
MKTMINSINPFDVIIDERQRKEFPDAEHKALKESIRKNGLFHAPGLRSAQDPGIVYGHRRVLALRSLIEDGTEIRYNNKSYNGEIPFVAVGNLDPLQLQEIELSENIDRLDLSWQDKARTMAALEELRNAQRESVAAIVDAEPLPITIAELASETKRSSAAVSDALAIAKHLDDPDVAKAKTPKEARKIIERKAKETYANDRAESYNPDASQHTLLIGDCRTQARSLPSSTFTAVVTDPPYGIEMHKDQSWDGTWHEYDDTEAYCFNLIEALLPEWDRVTTAGAHLYIFCDWSKFESIKKIVDDHGVFSVMPYPFIWNKGNVASYPRPEHWPRKSFECILYAVKGDKVHNKLDLAVIDIPQQQHHDHPAGKPHELYAHLIKRSCLAGDQVLDCFAGQGTIFKAAKEANVVATGIELSEKYATLAKNTLIELGE